MCGLSLDERGSAMILSGDTIRTCVSRKRAALPLAVESREQAVRGQSRSDATGEMRGSWRAGAVPLQFNPTKSR